MGLIDKIKKNKWMIKLIFNAKWRDLKKMLKGFKNEGKYYEKEDTHTNMKDLLKCTLCPNMCRFECPVYRVTQKEMYAPATKSRISYHMEKSNIPMDDLHTAEVAYMCTNCDGCQVWCPMDISTGDLLRGVRADLMDKEIYIPEVKEFEERVKKNKTSFDSDTFARNDELNVNMDNPQVFYYTGCVMIEKKPEAVKANIEILKKANVRFCTFVDERQCCGGPLYTLGFDDTVKEFGKRNLALLEKSGAKTIVADCPACVNTIANTYKELGLDHKFEVYTTAQYYKRLIEEGKLKPTEEVNETITYHDPCITVRKLEDHRHIDTGHLDMETRYNPEGFFDSARYIFSKIPGLKLEEPFLHGTQTQCCGRGGVSHVHHPEVSDTIGKHRVDQLRETGADMVVSSCPACEEGFMFNGIEHCYDISEILLKSLK